MLIGPEARETANTISGERYVMMLARSYLEAEQDVLARGLNLPTEDSQIVNFFKYYQGRNIAGRGIAIPRVKDDHIAGALYILSQEAPDLFKDEFLKKVARPLVRFTTPSSGPEAHAVSEEILKKVGKFKHIGLAARKSFNFVKDKLGASAISDGQRLTEKDFAELISRRFGTMNFDATQFDFEDLSVFYNLVVSSSGPDQPSELKGFLLLPHKEGSEVGWINEDVLEVLIILSGYAGYRDHARMQSWKGFLSTLLPKGIQIKSVFEEIEKPVPEEKRLVPPEKRGLVQRFLRNLQKP